MRKFSTTDQEFFDHRTKLAQKYNDADFWFIADNWPLFAGSVNIARFLATYELAKKAIDLPGHFCELGCWHGTNLLFLAKIVAILKPQALTEVIGFDSFQGLETYDGQKDASDKTAGRYKGNINLLEDALNLHKLSDFVHLVKGDVENTLPRFVEERKDIRFAFIYVDLDLYKPVKKTIELLYEKLLTGGIMVFDEYNTVDWPGETSAVHDVLGDNVKLHSVPNTRQPTAYIIK